jgi:hypothetical protein
MASLCVQTRNLHMVIGASTLLLCFVLKRSQSRVCVCVRVCGFRIVFGVHHRYLYREGRSLVPVQRTPSLGREAGTIIVYYFAVVCLLAWFLFTASLSSAYDSPVLNSLSFHVAVWLLSMCPCSPSLLVLHYRGLLELHRVCVLVCVLVCVRVCACACVCVCAS